MTPIERSVRKALPLAAVTGVLLLPDALLGYGGPGSVVTGIGALLAVLAAVVAAVFGFVWFPVKRLVARLRGEDEDAAEASEGLPSE